MKCLKGKIFINDDINSFSQLLIKSVYNQIELMGSYMFEVIFKKPVKLCSNLLPVNILTIPTNSQLSIEKLLFYFCIVWNSDPFSLRSNLYSFLVCILFPPKRLPSCSDFRFYSCFHFFVVIPSNSVLSYFSSYIYISVIFFNYSFNVEAFVLQCNFRHWEIFVLRYFRMWIFRFLQAWFQHSLCSKMFTVFHSILLFDTNRVFNSVRARDIFLFFSFIVFYKTRPVATTVFTLK